MLNENATNPDSVKEEGKEQEQENAETTEQNPVNTAESPAANEELEKLRAELAESRDKYLRLYSEFDNYRKRVTRERAELIKSAGEDIIHSLLPVLDDFERARKSMENSSDIEALKEGITLVSSKMKSLLEQKGLKEMETVGAQFDTDLHDALTSIPAPSEDMKGKVMDEVQKGYFLHDKVIRHAKVVIGQ